MSDTTDIAEGPDMTAAEFALGVLEEAHHRAAAQRLANDPAFAAEVAGWELRLAPLAAEAAEVTPPAAVWPRIEAAIGPVPAAHPGLWNSLGLWRTAAGIAAVGLVVMSTQPLWNPPKPPPAAPALLAVEVAKLAPAEGQPANVVATLDPNRGELVLTSVSLAIDPQKSAELWVIPKGQAPISLGVMDPGKPYRIALPAELKGAGKADAVLAVTVEQLGGSPDGNPHGPIVSAGGFKS